MHAGPASNVLPQHGVGVCLVCDRILCVVVYLVVSQVRLPAHPLASPLPPPRDLGAGWLCSLLGLPAFLASAGMYNAMYMTGWPWPWQGQTGHKQATGSWEKPHIPKKAGVAATTPVACGLCKRMSYGQVVGLASFLAWLTRAWLHGDSSTRKETDKSGWFRTFGPGRNPPGQEVWAFGLGALGLGAWG